MAAEVRVEPACCFHCGLPIPPGPLLFAKVQGHAQPMCCHGCLAVAEMLEAGGLSGWYARREGPAERAAALPADVLEEIAYLDAEEIEREFIRRDDRGQCEVSLLVDDLRCAACVWVIERHVEALEGVRSVHVSLETHRVRIVWDGERLRLRDLIERLAEIGFTSRPDRPGADAERAVREQREALIRLGISGLAAMNVMTYAVALYAGAFEGMGQGAQALMRWLGWLVSTPVVWISARPFFVGAIRDLRVRRPGMDVPVSLAIGGAYLVSAVATVRGAGEVYFESVCMFTFFLSLARYLELRVRQRSASFIRDLVDAAPRWARVVDLPEGESARLDAPNDRIVAVEAVGVGDRLRVRVGDAVPVDGIVLSGASAVDEALLTGEPWPRAVSPGDVVVAGSQNVEQPLIVEATRVGGDTTWAAILSLVENALATRAPGVRRADRVASVFVGIVLAVALLNGIAWQFIDPSRAIWTTLAVLVATCPCALSLAAPAAIGAATQGLARSGFLITSAHALETLAEADRVVLDKTGTLTWGRPSIARVIPREGLAEDEVLAIGRALERESGHPVAHAFLSQEPGGFDRFVQDPQFVSGSGIEGRRSGRRVRIGRPDWAIGTGAVIDPPEGAGAEPLTWVLLTQDDAVLAWFGLADRLRPEASASIEALSERGLGVEMLSGDPSASALTLAAHLGLEVERSAASPSEKLERIRALQRAGESVVVVGDGVNDAASLSAGDVSVAMGSGCDLTRLKADAVLLRDDLSLLPVALDWARRTRRIIRQNLVWAVCYNLLALPLAVSGHLSPWLAALGMSASSLIVVTNALRLMHPERPR